MKIRVIYDSALRTTAKPVTVFDEALKKRAHEMLAIMHKHNGIGLAANQVGNLEQLIVMEYTPRSTDDEMPAIPRTLICNPVIVKSSSETDLVEEGCLSLPGLELPVRRSISVVVEAQNLRGEKVTIKAKGMYARVLQHEIDHLNGVLFTDRVDNYQDLSRYSFAKTVFFGSDDFSLPVLQSLIDSGIQVIAVFCESDKPSGRGKQLSVSPVKTYAEEHGIAVFSPADKSEIEPLLSQLKPDLLVLASYGKILPEQALVIPAFGCLNVHPSLLPKYRGATPIQTAILDGETVTGVTVMIMAPTVDAGGIIAQEKHPIASSDTALTLRASLSKLGGALLVKTLPEYLAGQAKISAQDPTQVTRTRKLTKEDGEINWDKSLSEIDREIRAYQPWPGTFTWLGEKRLKIISAHVIGDKLALDEVQLEGKSPVNWQDFVHGYHNQLTKEAWYGKIYR